MSTDSPITVDSADILEEYRAQGGCTVSEITAWIVCVRILAALRGLVGFSSFTDGLRHGLYSDAASRLESIGDCFFCDDTDSLGLCLGPLLTLTPNELSPVT